MPSNGDPKVKAGTTMLRVKSPPVVGKANAAVIALVAERFGVNA